MEVKNKYQQSIDAGHSDSEILGFLKKNKPEEYKKFEASKKAGYSNKEIFEFLKKREEPQKQTATPEYPEESAPMEMARDISQPAIGRLEWTVPGMVSSLTNLAGVGESLSALEELDPARIEELKKEFPTAPWENFKGIDKEKYFANLKNAADNFPTPSNIARWVEEATGMPLEARTNFQKTLRMMGGGFIKPGSFVQKLQAALTTGAVSSGLQAGGVPQEASDLTGLAYGLHQRTGGFKLPPEQIGAGMRGKPSGPFSNQVPPGGGVPPSGGVPPAGGQPPEGPPIPPEIQVGETLPKRPMTHDVNQQIADLLRPKAEPIVEEKPKPQEKVFQDMQSFQEGKPLTGRVRQEMNNIGIRPAPIGPNLPLDDQIANIISPTEMHNTTLEGRAILNEIRELDDSVYNVVKDLYDKSKSLNKNIAMIHTDLANTMQEIISEIGQIPGKARSTPQRSLYGAAQDILKKLVETDKVTGEFVGYKPVNNQTLIEISQSLRKKVDHDFAHGDASGIFHPAIKATMNAAEFAAADEKYGNPAALLALKNARGAYRDWSMKFNNPYIRPMRDTSNADYSKTVRNMLDLDEYNYVKNILDQTPRGKVLNQNIAREIVKKRLGPHLKDLSKLDARAFEKELRELEPIITPEQKQNIKNTMARSRLVKPIKGRLVEKEVAKEQLLPKAKYNSAEDIDKVFKDVTKIKELREELTKIGKKNLFDKVASQHVAEIFRGDHYDQYILKGEDIVKAIDKKSNSDVLVEILGQDVVDAAYKEANSQYTNELRKGWLKGLLHRGVKHAIPGVGPIVDGVEHLLKYPSR